MSVSPNGRELLRLSVQQNVAGWQKAVKSYKGEVNSGEETLRFWRDGAELQYTFGREKTFLTQPYDDKKVEHIVRAHRVFLFNQILFDMMPKNSRNEVGAVRNYFTGKLAIPGSKDHDNMNFIPVRLAKLFAKLEKGYLKTEQEKEESRKTKNLDRLTKDRTALEIQMRGLETPIRDKFNLDQVHQELSKLIQPGTVDRVKTKINKILSLIAIMQMDTITPQTLKTLQIDRDTLFNLPSAADQLDFIKTLQTFDATYEQNRKEREDIGKRLQAVNEEIARLKGIPLPLSAAVPIPVPGAAQANTPAKPAPAPAAAQPKAPAQPAPAPAAAQAKAPAQPAPPAAAQAKAPAQPAPVPAAPQAKAPAQPAPAPGEALAKAPAQPAPAPAAAQPKAPAQPLQNPIQLKQASAPAAPQPQAQPAVAAAPAVEQPKAPAQAPVLPPANLQEVAAEKAPPPAKAPKADQPKKETGFFAACKSVLNWFKSIFSKFWSFLTNK